MADAFFNLTKQMTEYQAQRNVISGIFQIQETRDLINAQHFGNASVVNTQSSGSEVNLIDRMNGIRRLIDESAGAIAPVPGKKPQDIFDRNFKEQDKLAKAAEKRAQAIQNVVDKLTLENEQLGRNAEQQAVYNALA